MNKIGVLFDLDGVLIDSESVYTKFWAAAEKLYPTGIDNFAIKIKGTTLPDILSRYFPDIEVQKKLMKMINDFEASMQYIPFEEAMRFVDELSAANIPTAIVTSSSKLKMEKLYAQNPGFKEKFNAVITSDLVTYSKPHPQPYLLGAEALGVDISGESRKTDFGFSLKDMASRYAMSFGGGFIGGMVFAGQNKYAK